MVARIQAPNPSLNQTQCTDSEPPDYELEEFYSLALILTGSETTAEVA